MNRQRAVDMDQRRAQGRRYIASAMPLLQSRRYAKWSFGLMSACSARRWARRLLFVWLGMWLSAALLPCGEAVAAATAHKHALSDYSFPADEAPDSGDGGMTGACLVLATPVRAPAERLAVEVRAGFGEQRQDISSSISVLAPRADVLPSLAFQYRVAPPPVAFYLRSSRLLI